ETSGGGEPGISQIRSRFQLGRDERAARNRADDDWHVRVPVKAGERDVIVTFIAKTAALDEPARLPFLRPYPAGVNIPETRTGAYLRSVEISGPYAEPYAAETGVGASALPGYPGTATPSRERIFVCTPETTQGTS